MGVEREREMTDAEFKRLTIDADKLAEHLRGERRDTEAIVVVDMVSLLRSWHKTLVGLSTHVVRTNAGDEAASRTVQVIAAKALRAELGP